MFGENGKRPGVSVHDDLLRRDFTVYDINQLRLTDIRVPWTEEGSLYLCALNEAFFGRIVG